MWRSKLKKVYGSFREFKAYSSTYGIAERLGFESAKSAWDANPLIQGSTDPRDLKVIKPAKKNPSSSMWTYKGVDVFAADRNSSGIRWYARTSGGILRSDTKDGMKNLNP